MTATLDPQTPVTQDLHRIVAGGAIDAVTEYCDTSTMKCILFGQ